MAHAHSVYDTGIHFLINPITRGISRDDTNKTVLIQHDHNSERCTFELPRKVDGHDMMLCNQVQVHYINTDGKESTENIYEVDDLAVSPESDDVVVFSWLISGNATKYVGVLSFVIRFACLTGDTVDYAWHTGIYTGISVSSGILNDAEALIEPYVDVLEQWKARLFGVGDTQEQRLLDVSAAQQEAIQAKGDAVLASIPEEYTALQAQADDNSRLKAVAIVQSAEGESIVVNDSADAPLLGLKLFGRSTQDGTPTPDAPVEIVSVENPVVFVRGGNQFDESGTFKGGSVTAYIDNGVVSLSGTSSSGYGVLKTYSGYGFFKKGETYRISSTYDNFALGFWFKNSEKAILGILSTEAEDAYTLTVPEGVESVDMFYANVEVGTPIDLTNQIMIALGNEPKSFEIHRKQTISNSRVFSGVPVSDSGNYTDADGQQWICDEVDLERGVYIQRTLQRTISDFTGAVTAAPTNGHTEGYLNLKAHSRDKTGGYCDKFPYSASGYFPRFGLAGAMIYFTLEGEYTQEEWIERMTALSPSIVTALKTPTETPLSDAEIAAYKALVTHKPTTTILNDGGAHMAVEYAADTKTYIANAIAAAMTEGATT